VIEIIIIIIIIIIIDSGDYYYYYYYYYYCYVNLENDAISQFVEITKDAGHNVLLQASLSNRAFGSGNL
jgi:hypothetical protein